MNIQLLIMKYSYLLRCFSNLLSKKCSTNFPHLYASKYVRCLSSGLKSTTYDKPQRVLTSELHLATFDIDEKYFIDAVKHIKYAKESGCLVPELISVDQVRELAECQTPNQIFKYLAFLFKKEKMKLSEIKKKEKKRQERETKIETADGSCADSQYGLRKNTLLLRLRKHTFIRFYDLRLADALLFGQQIVIDLDYDQHMTRKEQRDCAAQLRLVHSHNRCSRKPYNLLFCNAKSSLTCVKYLRQEMPNVNDSLLSLTEENYSDIFPKDRLVYLSPHAKSTLKTYDHNAIYIIGGFVDTVKREHLSLQKAEAQGIQSYSLPIDEYVLWGSGSRSLSINQVFQIMMEMKNTGDWRKAFGHIPSRKIRKLPADYKLNSILGDKLFFEEREKNKL